MEQTYSKEVGMTLTIGQSLTPEQVRDLPDGAVVNFEASAGQKRNWYAWNSASREQLCVILEYSVRTSATLVSLPSIEPKAKPASEIEKEAAIALLRETRKTLYSYSGVNEVQPAIRKLNAQAEKASGIVSAFERAEAYARAIGAIE